MRIGVDDLVDLRNDVAKHSSISVMPSHGFEYLRSESQGLRNRELLNVVFVVMVSLGSTSP